MRKPRRGIEDLKDLGRIFREVQKIEKGFIAYGLVNAVLGGVCAYIGLFFVELVLERLESGTGSVQIIGVGILWILLYLSSLFCKRQYDSRLFPGFLGFVNQAAAVGMEMSYKRTMDAETLALAHRAQNAVSGSGVGLHKILTSAMEGVGNIIGCLATGAILGECSLWVPLYCLALIFLSNRVMLRVKKIQLNYQETTDEIQRKNMHLHLMMSDFTYGKDIRLLEAADWLLGKFRRIQKKGQELLSRVCSKTWKYNVIEAGIVFLREGGIVFYFIFCLTQGTIEISEFVVLLMGLRTFSDYGSRLMGNITDIYTQKKYMDGYFGYITMAREEQAGATGIQELCTVEFQDVSFHYPGSEHWVLKNFSLKICSGEKIALVGLNGAGKTTIVSLLCRFFEPTKGQILLNGIPISQIPIKEYYRLFAAAFQDAAIFSFSLRENITMREASERTPEDDIRIGSILKTVGLDEKIGKHTDYSKQNVSKRFDEQGMGFSGGEQCKLVLARALYKNAPCMLLDEPTAALDPIAEKELYEMIGKICGDKTVIFISHRMASAKFCDRIVFLKDGKVAEKGTFEELLKKKGEYAELFERQARYYEEERR